MAGPRPALVRRARRLLGYWRSETRTLRQGLVALVISTAAGFVAGLTLAHITGTLAAFPGLLILIPAAVGMKGTIFGAIGARLGTANAAGVLEINLGPAASCAGTSTSRSSRRSRRPCGSPCSRGSPVPCSGSRRSPCGIWP